MGHSSLSRKLFNDLKRRHEDYATLFQGAETLAACYFRLVQRGPLPEFYRPSIGIVVLSPDRGISPGTIFNWPDGEFYSAHVDPQTLKAEAVETIEYAVQRNRIRLLVLMAILEPDRRNFFIRLIKSPERKLTTVREALLTAYRARVSLESESEPIRQAVEEENLAIVEALYDPKSRRVNLDVAGTMRK